MGSSRWSRWQGGRRSRRTTECESDGRDGVKGNANNSGWYFYLARRYISKPPSEEFVKKEAHLEHSTKTVSTTMYQCDLSAFQGEVEEQVTVMAEQVRRGFEEYLGLTLEYIEDTIHEDFASQLGATVESLTADLKSRQQSVNETEQLLKKLKQLKQDLTLLRGHLSKSPEEAVRTSLPDLESSED